MSDSVTIRAYVSIMNFEYIWHSTRSLHARCMIYLYDSRDISLYLYVTSRERIVIKFKAEQSAVQIKHKSQICEDSIRAYRHMN